MSQFDIACSSFDRRTVPTAKHFLSNHKTNKPVTRTAVMLSLVFVVSSNVLVDAAAVAAAVVTADDVRFLPLVLFCTL